MSYNYNNRQNYFTVDRDLPPVYNKTITFKQKKRMQRHVVNPATLNKGKAKRERVVPQQFKFGGPRPNTASELYRRAKNDRATQLLNTTSNNNQSDATGLNRSSSSIIVGSSAGNKPTQHMIPKQRRVSLDDLMMSRRNNNNNEFSKPTPLDSTTSVTSSIEDESAPDSEEQAGEAMQVAKARELASLAGPRPNTTGTCRNNFKQFSETNMDSTDFTNKTKQEIYSENMYLKNEIDQLKEMLLNGLRGSNRFISGGQFRVIKSDSVNNNNNNHNHGNGNQSEMFKQLQHSKLTQSNLQNKVHSLTLENSNLMSDLKSLSEQLAKQTKDSAKQLADLDKVNQTSKAKLARFETKSKWMMQQLQQRDEEIEQLKKSQSSEEQKSTETEQQLIQDYSQQIDALTRGKAELEDSNSRLLEAKSELLVTNGDLKTTNADLTQKMQAIKQELLDEKEQYHQLEARLQEVKAEYLLLDSQQGESQLLQTQLSAANNKCSELQSDCDSMMQRLEAATNDNKQLSAAHDKLLIQNSKYEQAKAESDQTVNKLRKTLRESQNRVEAIRGKLKAVELDLQRCNQQLEQAAVENEQLSSDSSGLKRQQEELEGQMGSMRQLITELNHTNSSIQSEVDSLKGNANSATRHVQLLEKELMARRMEAFRCQKAIGFNSDLKRLNNKLYIQDQDVPLESTLAAVEKCITQYEARIQKLNTRVYSVEQATADSKAQIAEAERRTKETIKKIQSEALDATLQSLVRLAVVAPTVNVHLNNSKSVSCKAPMPSDKIKAIIENDILPRFSKIFIQAGESKAPDGSRLDLWLETMLTEMQVSIQAHLKDIFRRNNTNTTITKSKSKR